MQKKLLFVLLISVLALAACLPGAPQVSQNQIDQIVQGTLQALTVTAQGAAQGSGQIVFTPTLPAPAAPAATSGSISGKLSYPSSGIPPLLVIAFETNTGHYYWVQTVANQTNYQLDNLPPGVYHVFAYVLPDGKLAAAYDQFYVCGLSQGCSDVSLIDVNVQAGIVTPNIDPGDWYGDSTQWPSIPNDPNIPTLGVGGEAAQTFGSISGQLSYPSEGIPALTVVAFHVGGQEYYYVKTNAGNNSYQIDTVPAGNYTVVAYNGSLAGGYSQAVPCGLSVNCTDSSLIFLSVTNGQTTSGINPQDWYAPPGSFPANPVP